MTNILNRRSSDVDNSAFARMAKDFPKPVLEFVTGNFFGKTVVDEIIRKWISLKYK